MTTLNVFAAVISTGEFSYGKLCQDCTFVLANGESEGDSRTADQLETAEKNCATYEFNLGHLHTNGDDRWTDNHICYHRGTECEDDCECERDEFSSATCDMCGTDLAGYRHDTLMVKRELLDTKMTQEQFDKLAYLCKGYQVEMAIGDYRVNPLTNSAMQLPGWVESWVGGNHQANKTIFVGVSPEGDSHS